MTFKPGIDISGRGKRGGSGGPIAVGGGIGGLLLVGLYLLLGGDPQNVDDMMGQGQGQTQAGQEAGGVDTECTTSEQANERADCRIFATAQAVDQFWQTTLPEQAGLEYTQPDVVVFEQATQSGCGTASASTGPFYCPKDQSAYFDTSFFEQLRQLGGNDAPLTQSYVVAHEIGHHIQNLEGTLGLSNYNDPGQDSAAVALELQADCFAGMWAGASDDGPDAMLEPITKEQVAAAIETAGAIGDDNIQKHSGQGVNPDLWTHGSSEQRQEAFMKGYTEGSMATCDYLDRGQYKG